MMRQQRFKLLPPSLVLLSLLAWSTAATATPVYLRLDSLFPSGHYSRQLLEGRTKQVQFQRWMRVRTKAAAGDGLSYGWLPEDHLLTPLKLSSEGVLTEDVPVRKAMEMDAISGKMLAKQTPVLILEIKGSWVKAQPLPVSENEATWIPTESVKPLTRPQTQRAYTHSKATVFVLPGLHARRMGDVKAGQYVSVTKLQKDWLEIQYQGGSAFIRRADAWTLEDLGEKGARSLIDHAPLRSAPLPYSDLIANLPAKASLEVIEAKTQRWGLARVPDIGDAWWPISDEFEDEKEPQGPGKDKILTTDLFQRKIFDMASSPAIPSLKFVSAQGVYRTTDGQEWTKIPLFKNENYPISISSQGAIFIGPYVSDDQGETFQTWIRWDKLIATLKSRHVITPRGLQILDLRPEDATGRKITLKLNIGLPQPVRATTEDQGLSWRAL